MEIATKIKRKILALYYLYIQHFSPHKKIRETVFENLQAPNLEEEEEEESEEEDDDVEDVAAVKQPCILVFDSLGGSKARQARLCATLRDFLTLEYKVCYGVTYYFQRGLK